MVEVHLNGLIFVFDDDTPLMEWMDAHAVEVREEPRYRRNDTTGKE